MLVQECDAIPDCDGGSAADELNCGCDPDTEFACANECIPRSWACDGYYDCNNGADEANCPPITTFAP